MFHEDILYISYRKYAKKIDFLYIFFFFLHPQITDFQIVVSQPNIFITN